MEDVKYYSQKGLDDLKEQLHQLESVERPRVTQAIADARDKGDLSENAEYDAAKEAQGLLEMKIANLRNLIAHARVLDESKIDVSKVLIYSIVKIRNTKNNAVMTLGISPTGPETGYGYIQVTGGKTGAKSGKPVKVKTFTEKPDKDLAQVFYNSGEFFWNSGIFAWKASTILAEMTKYLPDVVSVFKGWENILGGPSEKPFLEKAYSECPKISIDYGVMEKTDLAWLYSGSFGWFDIDSWESLFKTALTKDPDGNATNSKKNL